MDDMTKDFYASFLNYISPKELKKLYSNLCKQKLFVNGYTPPKTPKAMLLAPLIAKNEKIFFNVLEKFYTPSFDNCDDATNVFAPDTAVTCLAYLVKNRMIDETFLMSLLEKNEDIREEIQVPPETGKVKKKAEEFREKYLSTRRKLLQVEEENAKLRLENADLKSTLETKANDLSSAIAEFQLLKSESERTINLLTKRVRELESDSISQEMDLNQDQRVLIILGTEELVLPEITSLNIDILSCENMTKLKDIIDNYDGICVLESDIPFSAKRKLRRVEGIGGKVQAFSSKSDMITYLKKNGGNTNGGSL